MVVICKYCDKEYASYASRSNHIKKYHNDNIQNTLNNTITLLPSTQNNELKCIHCNTVFTRKDNLKRHYNNCTIKKIKLEKENKFEEENKILKEQFKEYTAQIDNLKKQMMDLMNKQCKVHPKTLTKINKQLNTTNTLNDNKVINNNVIIQFGREKLYEVFSKKEQIDVLNHGYMCLENLIEKAHFNHKYPQFKNILITNLQNNIAYKYNAGTNNFDVVTKKELLEDIISERMYDIEEFFNNYKDDISSKIQTVIESFIKKMDTESYGENKKQNIKIILYNNRSKVKLTTPELDQAEELIV
jgi:hypothetical protein